MRVSHLTSMLFFFTKLDTALVDETSAESLEKPVTLAELNAAMKSLQNGKCLGPDGYPIEFFKNFWIKLAPIAIGYVSRITEVW